MNGCSEAPSALTLYVNGNVWTGDLANPRVEAFAVDEGRIIKTGSTEEVRAAFVGAREVDLQGRFITPGFIDNHVHFLSGGFQLASVDLRDAASPEEFIARIAEFAASIPEGRWITGGDWDHEAWGGQLPDRAWIDSVSADTPVFVQRLDGHMALANSAALEMAGITRESEDPDGGTIVRRENNEISGVLKDEAMNAVYAVMPDPTEQEEDEALERAMQHALSLGVTQVHDMAGNGWRSLETYRRAREKGRLSMRIYSFVPLRDWSKMRDFVASNGRGDEMLTWGGLKGFVDGSLGSTTAWFFEPYEDEPNTAGLVVSDTTQLLDQIKSADAAGLQLAVHAIGDRANAWLLAAFAEAASENGPRDRRFRIEHAQHLTSESISSIAGMGVVPSMQPYHAIDDGRWAEKRIGPLRAKTTYAFRSLIDAGAGLTFGSDWTVAPLNPLAGIYGAVTRRTIDGATPAGWIPEQKISVEEALLAYTASSAWAGFREMGTGVLKKGLWADFVVLSENLLDIEAEKIEDVQVLRTFVAGKEVFMRQTR